MEASTANAAAAPRAAPPSGGGPLRGFVLDLLLALAVMLVTSALLGLGWSIIRGAQIAAQHGTAASRLEPAQLAQLVGTPGPLTLLAIAALATGTAAVVALLWRRRTDRPDPVPMLRAWRQLPTWGWAVAAAAATLVLVQLTSWTSTQLGIDLTPSNLAVLEPTAAQRPWLIFGFAVLLAPVYEELLFRRVLFARMWRAGLPGLGLVLSSLAFALVHEPPGFGSNGAPTTAMLWLVYAGMGALFAWSYRRSGSLWTPIAAHALHNCMSSLGLFVALG